MPRVSSGTVFEKPIGSGRWYGKFTTSRGRKSVALVTVQEPGRGRTLDEAIQEFAGKVPNRPQRLRASAKRREHASRTSRISTVRAYSRSFKRL
jgi:hypothetical protein